MGDPVLASIKPLFFKTLAEKALLWYDSCEFETLAELTTGFLRHYSCCLGVSGDLICSTVSAGLRVRLLRSSRID